MPRRTKLLPTHERATHASAARVSLLRNPPIALNSVHHLPEHCSTAQKLSLLLSSLAQPCFSASLAGANAALRDAQDELRRAHGLAPQPELQHAEVAFRRAAAIAPPFVVPGLHSSRCERNAKSETRAQLKPLHPWLLHMHPSPLQCTPTGKPRADPPGRLNRDKLLALKGTPATHKPQRNFTRHVRSTHTQKRRTTCVSPPHTHHISAPLLRPRRQRNLAQSQNNLPQSPNLVLATARKK